MQERSPRQKWSINPWNIIRDRRVTKRETAETASIQPKRRSIFCRNISAIWRATFVPSRQQMR